MNQKSRLTALFCLSLVLSACGENNPTFKVNPRDPLVKNSEKPEAGFGEASSGDPSLWPTAVMDQTRVVCESPRGTELRSPTLSWTTAGATSTAGMRKIQFKVGDRLSIPSELKRPAISTRKSAKSFDLVFEGTLETGPEGGAGIALNHLFLGRVTNTTTQAEVWAALPSNRLELQNRVRTLPDWVRLSHAMQVSASDWVLPAKSGAATFELFSKNESDLGYEKVKALGLKLSDAFPVASFESAVVFQRNTGSAWTLSVVDNLGGAVGTKSVSSSARFVVATEKDAFWAWTQNSPRQWTLNRYALRAGSYSAESGRTLSLPSATLARRFEVLQKDVNGVEAAKIGWIIARDDMKKIQLYSESFELSSEIPYPANALKALSAEVLRAGSPVYVMEFEGAPGQRRASLVHALRSELRGPLTQRLCARPAL